MTRCVTGSGYAGEHALSCFAALWAANGLIQSMGYTMF